MTFTSCKKAQERGCWKAKGDTVSEERMLDTFDKIELYDGIDYRFIQDSLDFVVIETGENLINFIKTEVESGTLKINDENNCSWLRKLPAKTFIEIHFTQINEVYNSSFGKIDGSIIMESGFFYWDNWEGSTQIALNLNLDSAQFALHTGAPTFIGSGSVDLLFLFTSGACYIDATDLVAQSGQAHNAGIGNIRVHVEGDWLNCVVESYGNVYYTGSIGSLTTEIRGEGEVIQY